MNLLILLIAFAQEKGEEKKFDPDKTKLYVYDGAKKVTLRVDQDGKVELTVPDDDKESARAWKTYQADSLEEFHRKHPGVGKKHGLDRYLGGGSPVLGRDEFEKWWEELKKNRGLLPELPELPDFKNPFEEGDLQKLLEEQKKMFEEFRRRFRSADPVPPPAPAPPAPPAPAPAPPGKEFGIKVDSVGETLRDQLSLTEGEGVSVGELKPGSVAEKAGIQKHDIILKIDGKAVTDKWQFRSDVSDAMKKPGFELEVIRSGKRATLKVRP